MKVPIQARILLEPNVDMLFWINLIGLTAKFLFTALHFPTDIPFAFKINK